MRSAGQRRFQSVLSHAFGALLCFGIAFLLAGCEKPSEIPPPQFIDTNYAAVVTNNPAGGKLQVDNLALYYYPDGPKGANALVWPYLASENGVAFDKLVVFNGGTSEDVVWKYYPALFAYTGNGSVVEITQAACRQIPGWQPDWTNYAFSVLAISNQVVRLDASQRKPIDANRPRRLEVDWDRADILKAVLAAQTNAESRTFSGVKYFVAQ